MSKMTQVSNYSKSVIAAILTQVQATENKSLKIDVNGSESGIMPLSVEIIDTNIKTGWGDGILCSFCHYYECNGDLMRDPEIVYLVVDKRDNEHIDCADLFYCWPQMRQIDSIGMYNEIISFENGQPISFTPQIQKDVAQFTTLWMKNICWQQNIKPIKLVTTTSRTISILSNAEAAAKKAGFKNIGDAIRQGKLSEITNILKKLP